ncbi:MAG: DUF3267 domain-containing protein [Candidatus Izemoplasmatales bacterium]|nr:DUF3267 domain-containing protein [Candidatus Izemoplasmatales bacterium]
MENYYHELPEGYKAIKTIDAKDKKTIIWFNLVAIIMMVIAALPFLVLKPVDMSNRDMYIPFVLIVSIGMIAYIILHELTHGLIYKIYTKQKLTFGLTLFVAFCGVPNIYVSKKVSLVSVLAPFVLYSVILIPTLILMPANYLYLAFIIIFAVHFGGCVGDLYVTNVLLKLKGKILMNDTGPKQTFYQLDENAIVSEFPE